MSEQSESVAEAPATGEVSIQEAYERAISALGEPGTEQSESVREEPEPTDGEPEEPEAEDAPEKPLEDEDDEDDARKPTAKEARSWRAEKRRKQEELRAERETLRGERAQIERAKEAMRRDYGRFARAAAAAEKEDFLGVADALGIDPAKLNQALFEDVTGKDPKVRELERKLAAIEAEKERSERQRQEEHQRRQLEEAHQRWNADLSKQLETDQSLSVIAGNPLFVDAIRRKQEELYNETGEVPSPRKAWRRLAPVLEREYATLRKLAEAGAFGSPSPVMEETPSDEAKNTSRPATRRAGQVPRTRKPPRNRAEAGPPQKRELSYDEWVRKYTNMAESADD